MSKKLSNNGLFDSSRIIIPQHKEQILAHQFELNRRTKPIIDEQEWQEIGDVLMMSFKEHVRVNIEIFDPFEFKQMSGFVTVINTYIKEIKFRDGDGWDWIKFEDILSARIE